ncbi:bifunctional DedA family/phosphatase PAP2 family protein [Rhizobium grahamii]|uniref:Phosphatidic acid phosphatase type 2/haloperoxidase domain-containing protein n=1 Tax=Rhizobium grahamii TaxID=1120045 RepID=A0A370KFB3_9HYPH|nr:bifunctional DedA family/phosphatase PAP2 family protein [Rhizobium grahamii]RDJ03027.1 hypothetical protein B5K06_31590 [Rhizobium grahamii]
MSWLKAFMALMAAHPQTAYAVVLLLALSESLPILGAVIPGTAIIVGLAALVPSGVLKLYPLLGAAFVGAVVGDGFSFWLGSRYHREITSRWPFRRYPVLIEKSETFFQRHGGKSVFLARFTPGVRAFIPLVAGMVDMRATRFYVVNILSAALWAPVHVLPGVFAGAFAASIGPSGTKLVVLVLIAGVIVWLSLRIARYAVLRAVPLIAEGTTRLRGWARRRNTLASRFALAVISPNANEPPVLLALVAVLIGASWLFLAIAEDVVSGDPLVSFDTGVFQLLQSLRTTAVDAVMIAVTELGDTVVVVAVAATVVGWLLVRRSWRTAGYLLSAVAAASLFNTIIKVTVHRLRPSADLYTGWSNFSFPSGHSTTNAALYGFVAFLACRTLPLAGRTLLALATTLFVMTVAASRIYLGAHWFSDATAGLAFATVWLSILMISYLNHRASDERTGGVLAVAVISLAVAGSANIWYHHDSDVRRYAVKTEVQIVSVDDWWNRQWQALPMWRVDLTGELEEPFMLQWAGTLGELERQLESKGWNRPANWTLAGSVSWLNPSNAIDRLPSVPRFERGKIPSLVMVKKTLQPGIGRYVLYAWRSDIDVNSEKTVPLWLVSIVEERFDKSILGLNYLTTNDEFNGLRSILEDDLDAAHMEERSWSVPSNGWDGRLILSRGG